MAETKGNSRRKAWTRERTCIHCGKVDAVRKDNAAEVCGSCSSRTARTSPDHPDRFKQVTAVCLHCEKIFNTSRSRLAAGSGKYCSRECIKALAEIDRICLHCGTGFKTYRSRISGKTNSSANYCCLWCYHESMAIPSRTNGRGSRWIKIRRELIESHGKCQTCPETEKLTVHHMIPWRLTHDNRPENLVVLCRKCHSREDRLWEADLIAAAADFLVARENIRKRIFRVHDSRAMVY